MSSRTFARLSLVFLLAFLATGCASLRADLTHWYQTERARLLAEATTPTKPTSTDAGTTTPTDPAAPPPADSTSPPADNQSGATDAGSSGDKDPGLTPDPKPDTGVDALDLGAVSWLGTPVTTGTITATLTAASISGDKITTTYQPYSWPSNGAAEKPCDAICHLFYRQGDRIVGGKFDWWRNGGQRVKGLENVSGGYHGHAMPAAGTDTWTMISSIDGKQRSNVVKVEWK